MQNTALVMKTPITWLHFLVGLLTLGLTLGGLVFNIATRYSATAVNHEDRLNYLERNAVQDKENRDRQFERVNGKLDNMSINLTDILIQLKDKQNRKP